MDKSVKLVDTSPRSIVFIQLDKPIYKGGDEFNFRIFVLDQKMTPLKNYKNIEVTIFDSKDNIIMRFKQVKTSEFGVFDKFLKIAEAPNTGTWKIQVSVDGRDVLKNFEVQTLETDDFQVLVDAPQVVAYENRKIFLSIQVKAKDEGLFIGVAYIEVIGHFKGQQQTHINQKINKSVNIIGNKAVATIDFESDLGITYPTTDMLLTFIIKVIEEGTGKIVKIRKEISMRYKGKNDFQIVRKKYFKPSFKFPMKIRVKTLDGRPDVSFNQLTLSVTYENKNSKNKLEKDLKTFKINLKNGETVISLTPKAETEKITVKVEFAGSELIENIEPQPTNGVNEYMQTSFLNKRYEVEV